MVFSRFEREFDFNQLPVLYLDLIAYRSISNQLAESFNVLHQSPQVLLIKAKVCLYNASHNAISTAAIKALL
jgi:bacillithiol system protein YtxJ